MMITERSRFSKSRLILLLVGVIVMLIMLITAFLYLNVFRGVPVNPDTIMINKSDVMDGKLVLTGTTVSSASAYSGYTLQEKYGKLLLAIRYVSVPTKWHPSGEFRIEIPQEDIKVIQQVYLHGKGNREKLVWTRA